MFRKLPVGNKTGMDNAHREMKSPQNKHRGFPPKKCIKPQNEWRSPETEKKCYFSGKFGHNSKILL